MKYFMIAILKKPNNKALFILMLMPFCLFAQTPECNKETFIKEDKKTVPKEVCIPNGFMIGYVYNKLKKIDFNKDGFNDYVFDIRRKKSEMTTGDSTLLIFYKMNKDSTFTFYKEFKNVFPIYFNPDNEYPSLVNKDLEKIFDCYMMADPLYSIDIDNDTITIVRELDKHDIEKEKLIFKFDPQLNDWKLIKKKLLTQTHSDVRAIKSQMILSNFSSCEE